MLVSEFSHIWAFLELDFDATANAYARAQSGIRCRYKTSLVSSFACDFCRRGKNHHDVLQSIRQVCSCTPFVEFFSKRRRLPRDRVRDLTPGRDFQVATPFLLHFLHPRLFERLFPELVQCDRRGAERGSRADERVRGHPPPPPLLQVRTKPQHSQRTWIFARAVPPAHATGCLP